MTDVICIGHLVVVTTANKIAASAQIGVGAVAVFDVAVKHTVFFKYKCSAHVMHCIIQKRFGQNVSLSHQGLFFQGAVWACIEIYQGAVAAIQKLFRISDSAGMEHDLQVSPASSGNINVFLDQAVDYIFGHSAGKWYSKKGWGLRTRYPVTVHISFQSLQREPFGVVKTRDF